MHLAYPRMHHSEQKCSVLNDALWDVEELHCGVCELGGLTVIKTTTKHDMLPWDPFMSDILQGCSRLRCSMPSINTLRPRQNGRQFADDTYKCIFLNENVWIPIKISPKFVPKGPINNIPTLVQIMAWRRPGDKPLSGPMMVRLPTHICVTRSQWVKRLTPVCCSTFWKYNFKRHWFVRLA